MMSSFLKFSNGSPIFDGVVEALEHCAIDNLFAAIGQSDDFHTMFFIEMVAIVYFFSKHPSNSP